MIQLKKCTKLFGNSLALNAVSIDFSGLGLVLILGSNGAGKSTLLRACAGLLTPSFGEIVIDQPIAYLSQRQMLYPQLTAKENLDFFSCFNKEQEPDLEWLELSPLMDRTVSDLSEGQKARVGLARVLAAGSDAALLLDEPSAAFDQRWQNLITAKIEELSSNQLVLLVTHDPERYLAFASRVVIVERGLIAQDFHMTQELQASVVITAYREVLR